MNELLNKNIVIPENRQLDLLVHLLEKHNANIIRCPMFSILDTSDKEAVFKWIKNFIDDPFDIFIILTGEGLYRLVSFAELQNVKAEFIDALKKSKKLIRGPKPRKALSTISLTPDIVAEQPTTDGVIITLSTMDIKGFNIGVQLYGSEPNNKLIEFIKSKGALAYTVAPYVYASKTEDEKVVEVFKKITDGFVDMIVFTSMEQYKRLKKIAADSIGKESLVDTLNSISVASVGPVVSDTLTADGVKISVSPKKSFFLKPLVNDIVNYFN